MKPRARWLWLLLLLPALAGWHRLKFDADVLNTLPAELPAVRGLQLHQRHFGSASELVILLKANDAATAETAARSLAEALRAESNLVRSAWWRSPGMETPVQAASLVASAWLNQPPEKLAALAARLAPTNLPPLFAEVRDRLATTLSPKEMGQLSYDPLGFTELLQSGGNGSLSGFPETGLFASPDGKARLLMVSPQPNLAGYRECEAWLTAIKHAVTRWREGVQPAVISVSYTGRPAFMAEIGGGMERDTGAPSAGTLLVICLLFYATYRRWLPLFWLLAMLALTLAATLALGGLILGTINVVSLGFAAILFGLAEDFGIVMYQEWRAHPDLDLAEIKRRARPGIYWSAATTAGAFLLLNFSGLPGLGQLGTLVALGIGLAALFMVRLYLPPLWGRERASVHETTNVQPRPPKGGTTNHPPLEGGTPNDATPGGGTANQRWAWIATALLPVAALLTVATGGWPAFNRSPEALRPKHSEAYRTLGEVNAFTGRGREPLLVVVEASADTPALTAARNCREEMARLAAAGVLTEYCLPVELMPQPVNVAANTRLAGEIARRRPAIEAAAEGAGFTSDSLALTRRVLAKFSAASAGQAGEWQPASRWVLDQFYARTNDRRLVLGVMHPALPPEIVAAQWRASSVPETQVYLTSWELLGWSVSRAVLAELKYLLAVIGVVVIATLWLAFRRWGEVVLSLASLAASLLLLLLVMRLAGWQWNLMNLLALPLLLGIGVDFSLHILLALRRYHGNLRAVHAVVGKALLLAGATTVAAFASLSFSSNTGLASLGLVCAVGVVCCQLTAIYLLPVWWKGVSKN